MKILLICIFFTLASCIKTGDVVNSDDCINALSVRPVTYSVDIQPILEAHCNNCHGATVNNGAGASLTTYTMTVNWYDTVTGGNPGIKSRVSLPLTNPKHMPKDYSLNECQIYAIDKWAPDGLKP